MHRIKLIFLRSNGEKYGDAFVSVSRIPIAGDYIETFDPKYHSSFDVFKIRSVILHTDQSAIYKDCEADCRIDLAI